MDNYWHWSTCVKSNSLISLIWNRQILWVYKSGLWLTPLGVIIWIGTVLSGSARLSHGSCRYRSTLVGSQSVCIQGHDEKKHNSAHMIHFHSTHRACNGFNSRGTSRVLEMGGGGAAGRLLSFPAGVNWTRNNEAGGFLEHYVGSVYPWREFFVLFHHWRE